MKTICIFLVLFCAGTGCSVTTKKSGTIGIRFGTDIALYHKGADDGTDAEVSANIEPWLIELIKTLKETENEEMDSSTDTAIVP